jgi:hypothetical protein
MLKGPGLTENNIDPNPGILNWVVGRVAAMKRPMGRVATTTVIWVMMMGSVRYAKNWLRKERRAHESKPKVHIRKVHTGWVGSSVLDTVSRTSSMGDSSSSSTTSLMVVVVVSGFRVCFSRVAMGEGSKEDGLMGALILVGELGYLFMACYKSWMSYL